MIRTALTQMLGIDHPVCSAGMARVAQADLVTAVSNAGGLGCLGGVSFMPVELRAEIQKIKAGTDRPYAVNLLLPDSLTTEDEQRWAPVRKLWSSLPDSDRRKLAGVEALLTPGAVAQQVEIVLDAAPDVVVLTFATPEWFITECRSRGIKVFALVGSVGKAEEASAAGVDVIVAQGTEAGGHTGQRATLPLLQEVLAATDRPVLAAGGIATGAGLAAVLVAGAAGGWIGTPFLSCVEATNSPAARERIRAASGDRTVLTSAFDIALGLPWPARWPGRALVNEFTETWHGREDELRGDTRAAELVRRARVEGDLEHAPVYAGESVGLVTAEESATDVVRRLTAEATAALERAPRLLG